MCFSLLRILLACLVPTLFFAPVSVQAESGNINSPFDGAWHITYPCKGSTGVYEKMCAEGSRDYFELYFWSQGASICGTHSATGHLGNRIDEVDGWTPSITGHIEGKAANIAFRSSWGASGHARISIKGNRLHWKMTDEIPNPVSGNLSWMPRDAVLPKVSGVNPKAPTECSGNLDNEK